MWHRLESLHTQSPYIFATYTDALHKTMNGAPKTTLMFISIGTFACILNQTRVVAGILTLGMTVVRTVFV